MAIKDEMELDAGQFFRQIEGQLPEAQRQTLILLLDKYAHLSTATLLLDITDFNLIMSRSRNMYMDSSFPKRIGDKDTVGGHNHETANICLMQSTIEYLYGADCLNKKVKFDFRDE